MIDINNEELRICFPERNIYISRNHNYAFAAWEIARLRGIIKPNASLIHIDNHLDYCDPQTEKRKIESESQAIEIANALRIDEFIVPAQLNGSLGKCFAISDDRYSESPSERFERAYTWNHYEQNYRMKWFDETEETSVILDLDLDFFNMNHEDYNSNPVLMPDVIVEKHLTKIYKHSWNWDLTTVALSPEFCGGDEASLHLFNLFLEVFELNLKNSKTW